MPMTKSLSTPKVKIMVKVKGIVTDRITYRHTGKKNLDSHFGVIIRGGDLVLKYGALVGQTSSIVNIIELGQ